MPNASNPATAATPPSPERPSLRRTVRTAAGHHSLAKSAVQSKPQDRRSPTRGVRDPTGVQQTDGHTSCAIPFVRANVPPTIFPHGMLQSKNLASRRPAAADMAHIESTTIPMNNHPNTARSHADPFTNRSALRPPRRWPPA